MQPRRVVSTWGQVRLLPVLTAVRVLGLLCWILGATAAPSVAPWLAAADRQPASTGADNLIARRLPRVVYRGGAFVRHLRIVTITFSGDDPALVARLERFGDTIARTAWWREVTDGYCAKEGDCVGDGRPGRAVRLTATLPPQIHAVDVSALLRREARAGRLGVLDPDTALLVYLPGGVRLRDAFVPRYCDDGPRGYHKALRLDGTSVAYAVMPRCLDEAALTATASHEVLELVTSPDTARKGFAFLQSSENLGFTAAGVEPMDPCGVIAQNTDVVDSGFVVRRAWSNRAAAEGRDPCVPDVEHRPYLALVPRLPTVRAATEGAVVTITMDAAASQPGLEWAVSAFDLTGAQDGRQYVEVSLDKSTVTTGQTATLTITRRAQHPRRMSVVAVVSRMGEHSHVWPVAVLGR